MRYQIDSTAAERKVFGENFGLAGSYHRGVHENLTGHIDALVSDIDYALNYDPARHSRVLEALANPVVLGDDEDY